MARSSTPPSVRIPQLRETQIADRVTAMRSAIEVLVVTATEVERDAVIRRLRPLGTRRHILQGAVGPATYYLGAFGQHGVALTMCRPGASGPGASHAAVVAACVTWLPLAAVMVGVAFGKDPATQRVGDVLVSSQMISYEEQRAGARPEFRGSIAEASPTLVNRFRNPAGWSFPRADGTACTCQVGPVLSGETLVDDAAWRAALFAQFPQTLGGEMAGRGLFSAAAEAGVAWIVVKAIGAGGEGIKRAIDQPFAADAATDLMNAALSAHGALHGLARPRYPRHEEPPRSRAPKL